MHDILRINTTAWLTSYPERIPSCIGQVPQRLPARDAELASLHSTVTLEHSAAMEELLRQWLWGCLQAVGLFRDRTPIAVHPTTGVPLIDAGVLPLYDRWLARTLDVLKEFCQRHGDSITALDPSPVDLEACWRAWNEQKTAWTQGHSNQPLIVLVEACMRALPEILTGRRLATEVIFPDASMHLVEGVYQGNAGADFFNGVLADTAVAYVCERLARNPTAEIRILEIGAGTGGTTASVLPALVPFKDHIREYCYTDISKAFLMHAAEHYAPEHAYLTTRLFDVSQPIDGQGIDADRYDLAIAANVLHATRNIRHALRNAKAVLKKNGLLLLNELHDVPLLVHLTFGLLEGWWLDEDPALRMPGNPGLAPHTWQRVLEEVGFRSVWFPAEAAHDLGQQIIVAESDGVVRQRHAASTSRPSTASTLRTTTSLPPPEPSPIEGIGARLSCEEHRLSPLPLGEGEGDGGRGSLHLAPMSLKGERPLPPPGEPLKGEDLLKGGPNRRPEPGAPHVADFVTAAILQCLAQSLKISVDCIDRGKPFSDYGLDSILGVSFVKQLNDRLGIDLHTAIVFDHTSVSRLARHVVQVYGDRIRVMQETPPEGRHVVRPISSHLTQELPPTSWEGDRQRRRTAAVYRHRDAMGESGGIAVIGMSGQFPGAADVDTFWHNLINGVDGVGELPSHYLNQNLYYSPRKQPGKTYCRWGGILAERNCFDPLFFSISPREAESMSPHQRLILQESWKSLEDAGYNPKSLADTAVGVFVGAEPSGYFHESFTGSSDAIVASRLSYYLDLKGPAMVINTGCSSSGVALHLACESLRHGESKLALAGGVFAALQPNMLIGLSGIDMLSPTGRCHTFDKAADGTVFSEGVGMVVLKRLEDAVADGDAIYGVIRGSGVNQDGASNGITAPSGAAQEALITSVYERFGIDPNRIGYVEAHGTGTKLGDPVEANALVRAFRRFTARSHYCAVGSAKAHIGHTAASAGVIGLIKVLLSLKHHCLPGLLHFHELNPLIDLDGSPFYVNARACEWRSTDGTPLMAAINSFGHSGTNTHLVVEEYSAEPQAHGLYKERPVLVPLSAQTEETLGAYAAKLARFLQPIAALTPVFSSKTHLQRELTGMVADILTVASRDIDPDFPLADYGMEPAHVAKLRERLREGWQVDADLNALTRCVSLAEMVDYLGTQHGVIFEDRHGTDMLAEMTPAIDLEALAYTLQVGREAMRYRVVFLVRDVAELYECLTAFADGATVSEGCWRGDVPQGKRAEPLAADEESRKHVARWISEGKLDKVAEAWARGDTVDWQLLYGEERPPRLHLPTYPFARERYDAAEKLAAEAEARALARLNVENTGEPNARRASPTTVEVAQPSEVMSFEEVWEEQPTAPAQVRPRTVVCFLSDPTQQRALSDLVHRQAPDARLFFIIRDDGARDQGRRVASDTAVLRVNPLEQTSYVEAFQRLRTDHSDVDAVLYLWAVEDRALVRNPAAIVYMLQAMAATRLPIGRILLAGCCEPDALDRCYLEAWIGFERSLNLVLPNTPVAVIVDESEHRPAAWLQPLWAELTSATPQSVLYRNGKRHVCRIRPTALVANGTALRMGGTYLITGGCGRLGLSLARHLAETKAANLILTGRSPLDATKRAAIEALKSAGGDAFYIQADVCDSAAMVEGLERARQRFGAIHGVIHAAGIQGEGSIFEKSIAAFQRVLDPKIAGTLILDQVLRRDALDFLCYFSSSAAILGDFGGCDYAVASRFQAAHASWHNRRLARGERSGRATAIHWPLWEDGGMGFRGDDQAERLYLKSSGQRALRTREGLEIFEQILGHDGPHYLILAGQSERIQRFLASKRPLPASWFPHPGPLPEGEGPKDRPEKRRGGRGNEEESQRGEAGKGRRAEMKGLTVAQCVAWDLAELTGQLLRIPRHRLDPEANLADFGFDSISLTEFAAVLTRHFASAGLGVEITPALLFGYPTLGMLADYFMEKHGEAMRQFYRERDDADPRAASPRAMTNGEAPQRLINIPHPNPLPKGIDAKLSRGRQRSSPLPLGEGQGEGGSNSLSQAWLPSPQPSPEGRGSLNLARMLPKGERKEDEPIAIIGMSGRFPQARNVAEMWAILAQGRETVAEIPAERFDWRLCYGDPTAGKTDGKWCGCVPGVREFDPLFFEISPRQAETMDPRQRLLLQEAWNALEDAGYGRKQIEANRIGMFVGAEQGDYQQLAGMAGGVTASHNAILAARLAYFLNLRGPNMAIDTACSSGLVAVHQACLSLWAGECTTAIAAGVHLLLTPSQLVGMSQAGMLSTDGHCYAFDKRANGLVPGEAVAVVVLKRLSRAEADGDPIHAVIVGSGINYDGKTNGITAPNGVAQTELLTTVYERFRIDPAQIEYIVTHGTGTRLGDPVEVQALCDAFAAGGGRRESGYCALTSCKTNFGHTFAASGLVSLIALVQAIRHRTIPASLNCEQDSDYIQWQDSPFYVNKRSRSWPSERRIGAVSAFGMSGTNAHMVVRSYEVELNPMPVQAPAYLLVLSAKTAAALRQRIADMVAFLEDGEEHDLARLSYTLLEGRWHFRHRCAVVVEDHENAIRIWRQVLDTPGDTQPNTFTGEVRRGFTPHRPIQELALNLLDRCQVKGKQNALDRESYREDLCALADLYCQGYELPWERLFPAGMRRTNLPVYPFARETYWIAETKPMPAADTAVASNGAGEAADTMMLQACWRAQNITHQVAFPEDIRHLIVFCEFPHQDAIRAAMARLMPEARCLFLQTEARDIVDRFQLHAARILTEIQHLVASTAADDTATMLIQVVVPNQHQDWPLTGLAGLLQTAQLENAQLRGQVIAVDPETDAETLAATLTRECRASSWDSRVRIDAGQRRIAGWQELATTIGSEAPSPPWREGATYLITGGAGALGRLIARDIVARTPQVNVILVGRSAVAEETQLAALRGVAQAGTRIVYRQLDVANAEAVAKLVCDIERDFGGLNGIIHAAGVTRDNSIHNKTVQDLRTVLAPKVAGLVHLDRATQHLDLDFLVCFSSMTAALGNPGQADYAAANAFMDAYATYRNGLVSSGQRQGRTLSINWPLWREGGMAAPGDDEAWTTILRQNTGMIPMHTATGLRALYTALAAGGDQVLVVEGDVSVIRQRLFSTTLAANEPAERAAVGDMSPDDLRDHTTQQLKRLLADYLKLDASQIDAQEPLESYGIDSIMIRQLNQKLAAVFGKLSATLFYEYQTLTALADHLVREHGAACARWTGRASGRAPIATPPPATSESNGRQLHPHQPGQGQGISSPGSHEGAVTPAREPIAIIGISGRYPLAANVEEFWENLKAGRDCITEIPEDRWPLEGFYDPDKEEAVAQGKSYCKWGGFLDRFADFDCLFFNISPREALNMDPQERLFVEACWAVLEDAGYTRRLLAERHGNRVGVFAGITKTGFELYGPEMWQHGEKFSPHTSFSSVANRVSYLFNLCGPSMPIDTMCSSSLTAVHEACEHLLRHECELAIAGGVNLYLHPTNYTGLCNQRMLSVDGRCKSFGKGGNGYVPGEGVGVVLLKPLPRALADGDHIYAVIRATSINHDGKTNGYTVPNPNAQGKLIREALQKAGVPARAVTYIEAHGTGTDLGDPIEITGLNQAFRASTGDAGFCAIGSVKSNIGHLEAAAGIAGLTKVVLQLQHGLLVPSLHAEELNPNIDFAQSPFHVQRELAPWRRPCIELDGNIVEYSRIAGVSSFGAGGANAHVIVEEYREPGRNAVVRDTDDHGIRDRLATMIVLSARKEEQLHARAQQLLHAIAHRPLTDDDLASVAYTLQVGREAMEERLALIASSVVELAEKLRDFLMRAGDSKRIVRGCVNKEAVATFAADKAMARRIEHWLKQGQIAPLLELWVKGLDIDWHTLYGEQPPGRINLPTYPFAGRRFWLPGSWDRGPMPTAAVAPAATSHSATVEPDERPSAHVEIPPSVSTAADGKSAPRPKPRGIVLQPLTPPQRSDTPPPATAAPPSVDRMPAATPELIAKPTPAPARRDGPTTTPPEILREALAASLAEALFLEREEVALDKPFIDMGLDSIVAAEWVRALNTRYGTNLTVSKIYDHPTLVAFATFLEGELASRAPAPVAERLALDDVLQRVQQGDLDIADAYQLLQQLDAPARASGVRAQVKTPSPSEAGPG